MPRCRSWRQYVRCVCRTLGIYVPSYIADEGLLISLSYVLKLTLGGRGVVIISGKACTHAVMIVGGSVLTKGVRRTVRIYIPSIADDD